MKTHEEVKRALVDLAEKAVEERGGQMEQRKEGDRAQLEQSVPKAVVELGQKTLEEVRNQNVREGEVFDTGSGPCRHPLHPVSTIMD